MTAQYANDRFAPILLKKPLGGRERNFLGLLTRIMRCDVRDHVASQKNDHGASYRRREASKPGSPQNSTFAKIFGVARFSTFSRRSARSGRSPEVSF